MNRGTHFNLKYIIVRVYFGAHGMWYHHAVTAKRAMLMLVDPSIEINEYTSLFFRRYLRFAKCMAFV
jgi:hypothetical protein